MRFDKLTTKFQQALADAQSLAIGNDNGFIEPQHLLAALLAQEDGGTASILARAGVQVPRAQQALKQSIERLHKAAEKKGRNPKDKLLVFSDAMDVGSIEETYHHFSGRSRLSFGWGTNLTNDFVGCAPDGSFNLDPISLVCKVSSVDGHPAVKLSDNPEKATGMPSEIERYLRVFGDAGRVRKPVLV